MRMGLLDYLICVIHQIAKPNRRKWQQRSTRATASIQPRTRRLRFGFARPQPPESRAIAGLSWSRSRWLGKISAAADWVAVREVWGELVSPALSLLSRENTGYFSEIRLP